MRFFSQIEQYFGIVLTKEEHGKFTNAWRKAIGYAFDNAGITTWTAGKQDIWAAVQRINQDYPELLEAARKTIRGD